MTNKLNNISGWLIVVYVFLLPWQTVYIFDERLVNGIKSQFLTGQIFASELVLWLAVILFLFANFRWHKFKNILAGPVKLNEKRKLFVFMLWLFLAYAGLSIVWSQDRQAAYYLWLHFLEGAALLTLIFYLELNRIKLLWALALSAGLQGLLAMSQFMSQKIPAVKWLGIASHSAALPGTIVIEAGGGRWLRAYGAFAHPNVLAGWLALGLIACAWLWLNYFRQTATNHTWQKNNRPSFNDLEVRKFITTWLKLLTLIILSLIISAGLFFSFSRSAWLAAILIDAVFIISAGKFCWLDKSWHEALRFFLFPLSPILLFAVLFFIFNPLVLARADIANRLEARSQTERFSQLAEAGLIIKSSPLIGVGLNNYTLALSHNFPKRSTFDLQPVHNIYLLLLAELGFFGLALFLTLIISAWNLIRTSKKYLLTALPLIACLLIGLFDHYFMTQYAGLIMFWLALTISLEFANMNFQE